jgi:cell division protein FtsW (lipid II flippase)
MTSLILIQAATNIFVVLDMMPLTGLTLPFISYGGSSLLISLVAVGIIANVARNNEIEKSTVARKDHVETNSYIARAKTAKG